MNTRSRLSATGEQVGLEEALPLDQAVKRESSTAVAAHRGVTWVTPMPGSRGRRVVMT